MKKYLEFKPVTVAEWDDLVQFFTDNGWTGCWCMYWRKKRSEWAGLGKENCEDLRRIVESGAAPGTLAYRDGRAVGWCTVAPRGEYPALERSPTLKAIDDEPVWAITCFFVSKDNRRTGMTAFLVREAVIYAREKGAEVIEAYPIIWRERKYRKMGEAYLGFSTTFERLGFEQASDRSSTRNIMRLYLKERSEPWTTRS